jgi:E3 ubiquitin-protein ligase FANCL
MRATFVSGRLKWSNEKLVRENLEFIFEKTFPTKPSAESAANASIELECGICYTYAIKDSNTQAGTFGGGGGGNGNDSWGGMSIGEESSSNGLVFPEVHCDNSKCCRVYHHRCLVDWLKSLPSTRVSFHTLFGCCPYCQEPLCAKAI